MNRKINYFVTLDNKTMHWVRLGIFFAIISMMICAVTVLGYGYRRSQLDIKESEARVKYQESLIKQLGQPQIIEQRYFSPQEDQK